MNESNMNALFSYIAEKLPDDIQAFAENIVQSYALAPTDKRDNDFFFDTIRPMISKLTWLKVDTAKEMHFFTEYIKKNSCENEGTGYAEEIMHGLLESIDSILFDYAVQPFTTELGIFNPQRQQLVKKILTDDIALIKTVKESISCGYERNGVVIVKERVSVYVQKIEGVQNE